MLDFICVNWMFHMYDLQEYLLTHWTDHEFNMEKTHLFSERHWHILMGTMLTYSYQVVCVIYDLLSNCIQTHMCYFPGDVYEKEEKKLLVYALAEVF